MPTNDSPTGTAAPSGVSELDHNAVTRRRQRLAMYGLGATIVVAGVWWITSTPSADPVSFPMPTAP